MIAILSVQWGWPMWIAILCAFAVAMALGAVNGWLVIKTGLPSFIVTLAFLYILRGLTIYLSIATTRKTIIGGVRDAAEGDWLAASSAERSSPGCSSGWAIRDGSTCSSAGSGSASRSWTASR